MELGLLLHVSGNFTDIMKAIRRYEDWDYLNTRSIESMKPVFIRGHEEDYHYTVQLVCRVMRRTITTLFRVRMRRTITTLRMRSVS